MTVSDIREDYHSTTATCMGLLVFPIFAKALTVIDNIRQRYIRSAFPMERQKRPQIAFGDPDDSADPVHGEMPALDPSADVRAGDTETLCDVGNGEKFDLIIAVIPTGNLAAS